MKEDVCICIQRTTFVGYNIPRLTENYKRKIKIFLIKHTENRIFVETHKFNGKFLAN